MRVFAVVNMKGGVGKTTTAINLAYILATEYRQRVLLVDADGQCNATRMMLPERDYDGVLALLEGRAVCYDEVIELTEFKGLDMIPASSGLWALDLDRAITDDGRPRDFQALKALRENIEEEDSYDVMVIDCPPNFSVACISAIVAASSVIIPVLPDAYSAEGMDDLVEQIMGLRKIHPDVRVAGCLINQWHRADVVVDATQFFRESCPVTVFDTVVRRTDKVLESTWAGLPVAKWSPQSSASKDYQAWVRELMERGALSCGL